LLLYLPILSLWWQQLWSNQTTIIGINLDYFLKQYLVFGLCKKTHIFSQKGTVFLIIIKVNFSCERVKMGPGQIRCENMDWIHVD